MQFDGRHDPLTGVSSRAALLDVLTDPAPDQRYTLLVADLDGFSWVNDRLGYRVGDEVLRTIADRFSIDRSLRAVEVARTGDDEFGIVLECTVDRLHAHACRIIELAEQPIEVDGDVVNVSASVGITASPAPDGATAIDVLHWAVRACHVAREQGGGRYVVYSLAMSPSHRSRLLVDHLSAVVNSSRE